MSTPANLTILNSVREWQKRFNQAFNLSSASADQVYASTQTIAGGLIICRNFTVNAGVTITISNPTTIICQTFTNNGTITMSQVSEEVLHQYRFTDAARVPTLFRISDGHVSYGGGTTAVVAFGGAGGASFGDGGHGSNGQQGASVPVDGGGFYYTQKRSPGWKTQGMALWWPVAYFRNPLLSIGGGSAGSDKPSFACSLAWQTRGSAGARGVNGTTGLYSDNSATGSGGNPGSFLEVYSRVSVINSATGTINSQGASGVAGTQGSGGGGGGGGVGIYSEGFVSQLGTINVSGGSSGGANYGAGGGGGGIFLTAPTITNTGTNTVAGGTGNTGGQTGGSGVVVAEPYLRLWMPGEDDAVSGTRYAAT
jgi:hypothetical protein